MLAHVQVGQKTGSNKEDLLRNTLYILGSILGAVAGILNNGELTPHNIVIGTLGGISLGLTLAWAFWNFFVKKY